MGALDNLHVSS